MKVFTVIGVILTIAGGVLLFYSFTTPTRSVFDFGPQAASIAGFVLLPMGLVFTAVGVYVGRLMGRSGQLIAQGLPGRATVLAVSDSNVSINGQPLANLKLQVQVAGRPAYVVDHRQAIPLTALGMITPGSSLPVAVDAADPTRLTIDWGGQTLARSAGQAPGLPMSAYVVQPNTLSQPSDGAATAPGTLPAAGYAPQPGYLPQAGYAAPPGYLPQGLAQVDLSAVVKQLAAAGIELDPERLAHATVIGAATTSLETGGDAEAALRANGIPARAVIREVHDLGAAMMGERLFSVQLDVTPPNGAPYQAQAAGPVPQAALARAVPGANVPVAIDPTNFATVVVEWDRA